MPLQTSEGLMYDIIEEANLQEEFAGVVRWVFAVLNAAIKMFFSNWSL